MIKAPRIQLIFVSQTPPVDPKFSPPLGIAEVNPADGSYDFIMSHIHKGIVPGKHKVIVRCISAKDRPITDLVGVEYADLTTTPLVADTANPESFTFKINKYSGPAHPNMQGQRGMRSPGMQYPGPQGGNVQGGRR
ncbi:MAG TPA: hypothetical protein VHX65_11335 [Pirellulales bacterium]|nr:hypothetical protein [Pirellulales bacterium]